MATQKLQEIAAAQTIVTTAETVIATSPAIQTGVGQQGVWLSGDVEVTVGTAATTATIRARLGSVSGTIVDTVGPVTVTPTAIADIAFNLFDLTTISEQTGGQVYVITIAFASATGNSTVNGGHLGVEV